MPSKGSHAGGPTQQLLQAGASLRVGIPAKVRIAGGGRVAICAGLHPGAEGCLAISSPAATPGGVLPAPTELGHEGGRSPAEASYF